MPGSGKWTQRTPGSDDSSRTTPVNSPRFVETFRSAAERLLGLPQPGDDAVLRIAFETTFALLADWTQVCEPRLEEPRQRQQRGVAPVVVLHRGGAAFGRVEG